jgi:hypothetical protein
MMETRTCPKCHSPIARHVEVTGSARDGHGGELETYIAYLRCQCGYSNESLGGTGE